MTTNDERKVALRKRTKAFASTVVRFYIGLDKRREELRVLGKQLLRAGTSVAANYRESSRARSVDEFVAKAEICIQEADDEAGRRRRRAGLGASCKDAAWRVPLGRRSSTISVMVGAATR